MFGSIKKSISQLHTQIYCPKKATHNYSAIANPEEKFPAGIKAVYNNDENTSIIWRLIQIGRGNATVVNLFREDSIKLAADSSKLFNDYFSGCIDFIDNTKNIASSAVPTFVFKSLSALPSQVIMTCSSPLIIQDGFSYEGQVCSAPKITLDSLKTISEAFTLHAREVLGFPLLPSSDEHNSGFEWNPLRISGLVTLSSLVLTSVAVGGFLLYQRHTKSLNYFEKIIIRLDNNIKKFNELKPEADIETSLLTSDFSRKKQELKEKISKQLDIINNFKTNEENNNKVTSAHKNKCINEINNKLDGDLANLKIPAQEARELEDINALNPITPIT